MTIVISSFRVDWLDGILVFVWLDSRIRVTPTELWSVESVVRIKSVSRLQVLFVHIQIFCRPWAASSAAVQKYCEKFRLALAGCMAWWCAGRLCGTSRTKEKLSPTFYVLPPLCSSLLSTNCLITSCLCPFTILKCLKTFCCLLFKSWVLQTRHKWLPGISEISRSGASAAVQTKISWEIFNIYYWLESLKIQVPGECWAR